MSSRKKKKHSGPGTRRAYVPEPNLMVESPLVVACTCPHCHKVFDPLKMKGTYSRRQCPSCGEEIHEAHYDALAKELLAKRAEWEPALQKAERGVKRANAVNSLCHKGVLRLFRRQADRYLQFKAARRRKAREEIKSFGRQLKYAAKDRYYTGEWFQSTHIPLKRTVVETYQLNPYYDDGAQWHMPQGNRTVRSMVAEYEVFSALECEVNDKESVLFGARILPNLYLPNAQSRNYTRPSATRFWNQTDLVLLTTRAAFVIEVKRRTYDITANAPFECINSHEEVDETCRGAYVPRSDDVLSAQDTAALSQNSKHALAFSETCYTYPYDRTYEQVVFRGVHKFGSDTQDFVDNVNVSASLKENPSLFIESIKGTYEQLDDFISQAQLNCEADELLERYGDLEQKKFVVHVNRIKNLRSA